MINHQQGSLERHFTPTRGYVLGAAEGEHLLRNGGDVFVGVDPSRGSDNLALGTQQVPLGFGIPIHQHMQFDEAFYVLEGTGTFILEDTRQAIGKGSTIFIPKGAWHGFENPNEEMLLLWVVSPPGLEGFFRAVADTAGTAPKPPLTREQLNAIAGKYGTFYRP